MYVRLAADWKFHKSTWRLTTGEPRPEQKIDCPHVPERDDAVQPTIRCVSEPDRQYAAILFRKRRKCNR